MSEEWGVLAGVAAPAAATPVVVPAAAAAAAAAGATGTSSRNSVGRPSDSYASQRLHYVPPAHPDLVLRAQDGDEFPIRKAYLELSSEVFRDMLAIHEVSGGQALEAGGGPRKRKRVGGEPGEAPGAAAGAKERPIKQEFELEVKREVGNDVDWDGSIDEGNVAPPSRSQSSSPAPAADSDLPIVDVSDSAKDLNLFLIAVHNQFSLNESLSIEEVELLLRLADKYESSAVTLLAFFHLQPLVPRQFNRALALGTLYKHFNTVRLAIKYQRSSPVKMKGIPQDLFVQLSSSQLYALLQVEASVNQPNYRSPDWPKLAKDLGIDLPYAT